MDKKEEKREPKGDIILCSFFGVYTNGYTNKYTKVWWD